MNATVAKIESILKDSYDINRYVDLVREIFPGVSIVSPDKFRKEYTNFSSHIEGSAHVGNYKTPDKKNIIILAVQLKKAGYVENSRSTQRSYAKKLIENANADAAFIAFFTEGETKWRLSFVRLDYEMKFENGKLKTAENMTPAKRYSYLVGQDEPCHTAITQFGRFITDSAANPEHPTLDDLENAFSVEKVTGEFFSLYCEKFHELREQLEKIEDFRIEAEQHNFTSAQFAKKLMGQIVFLYFLQKKGWLGVSAWPNTLSEKEYKNAFYARGAKSRELIPIVYRPAGDGTYRISSAGLNSISDADEEVLANCVKGKPWGSGPHDFMRKLFNLAVQRNVNFFDSLLEPLFYDALNRNRGEQGYCPALHCRIPFLSGGLFEPIDGYDWEHNDFSIPNEIFSNAAEKGRDADGILDIFDRYNFTMSEDEPMEREVAIDPEMLGKVFENLLEINDRKSKGAFYTPREIVHYMCQESLINYLTNALGIQESAIRDFILYGDFMKDEDTVKEKRQGNGGMYISEELYKINPDGTVAVNRLLDMDKALKDVRVADPAVGSGAFPLGMLNEIVRARQNISAYLAITMKPYDIRMMYQLERSPHALKYETIRNCIFACDIEPSAVDIAQLRLWLALVIDDEINPDAQTPLDGHRNPLPLPNLESNILCGNSLIDEFEGVRLVKESDILGNTEYQRDLGSDRFDAIIKKLIETQDELFRCDNTEKKSQLKEQIEALRDMIIMSQLEGCDSDRIQRYHDSTKLASKPYVLWQLDFARVFREKGGFDIVIGNPPYISAPAQLANKALADNRATLMKRKRFESLYQKWDLYVPFIELGMQLLHTDGNFSMIVPYALSHEIYAKKIRILLTDKYDLTELVDLSDVKVFEATVINCIPFAQKKPSRGKTIISKLVDGKIQHTIVLPHQVMIKDRKTMVWTFNEHAAGSASKHQMHVLGDYGYISVGFVPNSDEKETTEIFKKKDLISDFEDDIPRHEYIEGKDIEPYKIMRIRYMEYGTNRAPSKFRRPTFPELYQHTKILCNRIGTLKATIDCDGRFIHNDSVIACVPWINLKNVDNKSISSSIKKFSTLKRSEMELLSSSVDIRYLAGVLNSRRAAEILNEIRSGGYNIYPEHIRNIPIPNANANEQNEISELVQKALDNSNANEFSKLEDEINRLVEELYKRELS